MHEPTPLYVPPHVTPPETARISLAALRESAGCIIRTWPREVYEAEVWEHPAGGLFHVMGPDAVRTVLCDRSDIFVPSRVARRILRPIWRSGVAVADGESWRWQRRAASVAFAPSAAADVVPHANCAAAGLISAWRKNTTAVEITRPLARATTFVVLDALFDRIGDEAARESLIGWSEGLDDVMSRINYADLLRLPDWTRPLLGPTFDKPARRLHSLVGEILRARIDQLENSRSLLDELARTIDPETGRAMSEALLEDQVVGLLAAGRETTALALAWALYLIAHHEPTEQCLVDEIKSVVGSGDVEPEHLEHLKLTRNVLLEAMRLYPPAPQLSRDCLEDTSIAGRRVKKGWLVVLPIYAIHRHKSLWRDPDAFEPDRFDGVSLSERGMRFSYLPFGAGPRICLGMWFALAEATVILARLVRELHFSDGGGKIDFAVGAALRPRFGISLRVSARPPGDRETQVA